MNILEERFPNCNNKIVVIDGLDGVGKTTQVSRLKEKFPDYNFIKFPDYSNDAGTLIKEYLNGSFSNFEIVNNLDNLEKAKKYSILYTLDRLLCMYRDFNCSGDRQVNIFDRYTTSNIILQTIELNDVEILEYINWLEDLEYNIFKLPRPDLVIFLDIPFDIAYKNTINRETVNDIHEDLFRMKKINDRKGFIVRSCGWKVVNCFNNETNKMRDVDDINEDIINYIKEVL